MARFYIIVNLITILCLIAHAASTYPDSSSNDDDNADSFEEDEVSENIMRKPTTAIEIQSLTPLDDICPENEEFSNCTQNICRDLTCRNRGKPLDCTKKIRVTSKYCKSGCVCQSGFLRTRNGKCVPEDQCYGRLVCKDGEVVNTCPNYSFNDRCPTSQKEAQLSTRVVSGSCGRKPVCSCRFNYMRAKNGTCIPTTSCPAFKCSGKFEEYNACPPICPSGDCSQATPDGECPRTFGRIGIVLPCRPNCRCIPGYFKNNGVCVPYAQCPGKCPTNEEFSSCAQAICRAEDCTQRGNPVACPRIAEGSCEERCVCIQGTLRNTTGSCVLEDQCPTPTCGKNEIFNTCPGGCASESCPRSLIDEQEYFANCVSAAVCLPSRCTCLPDYRRDSNGECIYIGKCPGICQENEEFSKSTDSTGVTKRECVCKKGYSRNKEGKCMPVDQACGKNTFVNRCPGGCATENCPKSLKDEQEYLATCISPAVCFPTKCTCLRDFRRDKNGECIYIGDCPNICPENEVYSNKTDSKIGFNKGACVCEEGFTRNEQGKCVKKAPPQCGQNEELSCVYECPPELTCEMRGIAFDCLPPTKKCEEKCVCKDGYFRNPLGECISDKQCDLPQCGQNEELSCVFECPPEITCRTRGIAYRCQAPTKPCEEKCICKDGFFRNSIGECITNKQCDQCNKTKEFYTCGPECDNECKTLSTQNRTNCPIQNIMCNKCYCENGFARDAEGNCIPSENCPKNKTCTGVNEEYYECKPSCGQEFCKSIVSRFDCSTTPPCEPGCACSTGFFRVDKDTPCMDVRDCPELKGLSNCPK